MLQKDCKLHTWSKDNYKTETLNSCKDYFHHSEPLLNISKEESMDKEMDIFDPLVVPNFIILLYKKNIKIILYSLCYTKAYKAIYILNFDWIDI
jgi:hypothetical protein